jgi:small subunit ribosomal protein S25e
LTIMGGAKKRSMAQMEKTQDQPDKGKDESAASSKKGAKGKTIAEKRARGLQAPDLNDPKFVGEVGKMSAITPYSLASQFNVKLSVAKDLLEELERRKLVTLIGGNARIRIYQPAAA